MNPTFSADFLELSRSSTGFKELDLSCAPKEAIPMKADTHDRMILRTVFLKTGM